MAERVGMMHVWVGSRKFGRTLAPKRIESPATLQIEDDFKGFPTITYFLIFRHSCGVKLVDQNKGTRPKLATFPSPYLIRTSNGLVNIVKL